MLGEETRQEKNHSTDSTAMDAVFYFLSLCFKTFQKKES